MCLHPPPLCNMEAPPGRGGRGGSAAPRADAAYVANLKQQMYLLELESSILKQHGAAAPAMSPGARRQESGPGAEFDRLVGQLRASWGQREEALVEALRVVKRDLSKHKQLSYSQQSLIGQLKTELQLLRQVKLQDDETSRRLATVSDRCVCEPMQGAGLVTSFLYLCLLRMRWMKLLKLDGRLTDWQRREIGLAKLLLNAKSRQLSRQLRTGPRCRMRNPELLLCKPLLLLESAR